MGTKTKVKFVKGASFNQLEENINDFLNNNKIQLTSIELHSNYTVLLHYEEKTEPDTTILDEMIVGLAPVAILMLEDMLRAAQKKVMKAAPLNANKNHN